MAGIAAPGRASETLWPVRAETVRGSGTFNRGADRVQQVLRSTALLQLTRRLLCTRSAYDHTPGLTPRRDPPLPCLKSTRRQRCRDQRQSARHRSRLSRDSTNRNTSTIDQSATRQGRSPYTVGLYSSPFPALRRPDRRTRRHGHGPKDSNSPTVLRSAVNRHAAH